MKLIGTGVFSANRIVSRPAAGTLRSAVNYERLIEFTAKDPSDTVPVAFSVSVEPVLETDFATEADLLASPNFAGAAWTTSPAQGDLRVSYSVGSLRNVRVMDVRPGMYQLPPCANVTVDVRSFNEGAGAAGDIRLSVSIAAGIVPDPDLPSVSGWRTVGAGAFDIFPKPNRTRMFRFGITSVVLPATQVRIFGVQPFQQIDYAAPSYVPDSPDLVSVPGNLYPIVNNAGAAAADMFAQALFSF